jgi:hypothetical protein
MDNASLESTMYMLPECENHVLQNKWCMMGVALMLVHAPFHAKTPLPKMQ